MFPVQYRKSERTTIDFCKFVLVKVPNFSLNWQAWIYGPNLPKKGALNQNKKSEQRHCILHIRISGCPKFQIKLTILQNYALLISIEASFHFDFLWYSSFVINFSRFLKRLFRPTKILLVRHSRNNYQLWLYELNLMCEELSYEVIDTSAVNQTVFCYY